MHGSQTLIDPGIKLFSNFFVKSNIAWPPHPPLNIKVFKITSWLPSSCGRFLFNPYLELMQNHLSTAFLLLWSFLIQFLLRIDAKLSSGRFGSLCGCSLFNPYAELMQNCHLATKYSSGCLASPLGCFLFNSYSNLMQSVPLDTLALVVVVSYSILIQI